MSEIDTALPEGTFTRFQKRSRAEMEAVVCGMSDENQALLIETAHTKRAKLVHELTHSPESAPTDDVLTEEDVFLRPVSDECRQNCVSKFIDDTGKEATLLSVCAVCAGRFFRSEMETMTLSKLQSFGKLCPHSPHNAHVLTDGMLLYQSHESIYESGDDVVFARVCNTCASALRHEKTPSLALANGMWIGDVPLVLKLLTLPERILVARYFPAAYIVKLFPQKKGARTWASPSSLHCGLRGNVSTYPLNTDQISHMVGDNCMPPPVSILAATIGVTFVGPKNLPQKTLPGFLRVSRERVRMALEWLKENNPIYSDIYISNARLKELPVDGVPEEISSVTKYSNNTSLLARESTGYVPEEPDDDVDGALCMSVFFSQLIRPILTGLVSGVSGILDMDDSDDENGNEGLTVMDGGMSAVFYRDVSDFLDCACRCRRDSFASSWCCRRCRERREQERGSRTCACKRFRCRQRNCIRSETRRNFR